MKNIISLLRVKNKNQEKSLNSVLQLIVKKDSKMEDLECSDLQSKFLNHFKWRNEF